MKARMHLLSRRREFMEACGDACRGRGGSRDEFDFAACIRVHYRLHDAPEAAEQRRRVDAQEHGQPLRVVPLADLQENAGQARVTVPEFEKT